MLDTIQRALDTAVADDSASGVHRVSREIFTDPEIFELEMKHIFEGNWIYLAHESQIPNKNDYFTTYIGRQPIFITRNKDNEVNAFINACSHRGSMICRHKRGNKATFTCSAVYESSPLQRRLRDLHAAAQHAAIHQRHYVAAGKVALAQFRGQFEEPQQLAAQ
jgi:Rieske [2Fe-2S] domain/Acyl-CoA dehydrogenase, C-terminal domain